MARLLIRLRDNTLSNKTYRRGDFVTLVPDGHDWGLFSTLVHDVFRLELVGISDSDLLKYVVVDEVGSGQVEPDGTPIPTVLNRRRWKFKFDDLIPPQQNLITVRDANGTISPDDAHLVIGTGRDASWNQTPASIL